MRLSRGAIRAALFIGLPLLTCTSHVLATRDMADEQEAFINSALSRIVISLAEEKGADAATLRAASSAEKDANDELEEAKKARVNAEERAEARRRQEAFMMASIDKLTKVGASVDDSIRDKLAARVSARAEAEQELERREREERDATAGLERAGEGRRRAESEAAERERRRRDIESRLERLLQAWRQGRSAEDYIELAGQITAVARERAVRSDVTFSSSPSPGAVIKYQGLWERKHNVEPSSVSNPTSTTAGMDIGEYYIWSERSGRATSDTNRKFTITREKETVTVVEDR